MKLYTHKIVTKGKQCNISQSNSEYKNEISEDIGRVMRDN